MKISSITMIWICVASAALNLFSFGYSVYREDIGWAGFHAALMIMCAFFAWMYGKVP